MNMNSTTAITLNDRFSMIKKPAMPQAPRVNRSQIRGRSRSRSRDPRAARQRSVDLRGSHRNQALLSQLERQHKMRIALKLKNVRITKLNIYPGNKIEYFAEKHYDHSWTRPRTNRTRKSKACHNNQANDERSHLGSEQPDNFCSVRNYLFLSLLVIKNYSFTALTTIPAEWLAAVLDLAHAHETAFKTIFPFRIGWDSLGVAVACVELDSSQQTELLNALAVVAAYA